MKVSVIIPTYFRQYDLAELFDSILLQTYKPLEVIVVDDTPTSDVEKVCKEYKAKFNGCGIKFLYLRNHRKRSLTIARNIGVEMARGDIILFLDSDIILFPIYIECIVEVFRLKPLAVGVQGWIVSSKQLKFYYARQVLYKIFYMSHYSKNRCKLCEYPSILTKIINCEALSGSNFAIKREIFNKLKFDENLLGYSYMEDLLFSHTLYRKCPDGLFITPYAKCIHKVSPHGRMESKALKELKRKCRLYVLTKLFGFKGLLIYHWQNVGELLIRLLKRVTFYGERKIEFTDNASRLFQFR